MDRGIIKSELVKIKSYFFEKKINKEEILKLLNIKNFTSFDEIRDAALNGEKKKTNQLLSEVDLQNEDAFLYLNNLNKRITNLQQIIKISSTTISAIFDRMEIELSFFFMSSNPYSREC